jgi:tetratricopeptide (TPR) repeat protein
VCETDVRRPSLVGGAELRGDLDIIVLTAMHKVPARRYNSAEQFSEDVRRHLKGFPVRARPDTLSYRTGKFLRRNWFTVTAMTLIVASLTGGILIARLQAQRAEEEFQQARRLAHMALFDVSRGLSDLPGARPLRDRVVRGSLEYLDRLTPRARRDPELRNEIAEGYYQIGQLQHSHDFSNAGDAKGALRSWQRALGLIRDDASGDHPNPDAIKLMSDLLLSTGEAEMSLGHVEKAREALSQAEPPARAQIARHPETARSYGSLLSIYNLEGDNELRAGDPRRALERYLLTKQAGEESGRKTGEDPSSYLVSVGIRLGDVYRALGRVPDALDWYQRSLTYVQAQAVQHPGDYFGQLYQAILHGLLGELYFGPAVTLHDRPKALAELRQGYERMDRLQRADPNDAQVRDFFIMLGGRYVYALRQVQAKEALAIARRVADLAAGIPHGTGLIDFEIDRVAANLALARALAANGDRAAAGSFADAARIYREARGSAPGHPDLAAQGILAILEWGDWEGRRSGGVHYAEAYQMASEYKRAFPANRYIAALCELAALRLR